MPSRGIGLSEAFRQICEESCRLASRRMKLQLREQLAAVRAELLNIRGFRTSPNLEKRLRRAEAACEQASHTPDVLDSH